MALLHDTSPEGAAPARSKRRSAQGSGSGADRSWLSAQWYRFVRYLVALFLCISGGIRATGRRNVPRQGAAILVANHLSHLDVFVLGIPLPRPLNYVARSTLFKPVLGPLIRSVGGFAIQREGMGVSGLKETLKRLKAGGLVTFFPEGTRSPDGELGPLKPGIAALVAKAKVPIIPVGIAGTFQAWPRTDPLPHGHAIRIHFGPAIPAEAFRGLDQFEIVELIRTRMLESQRVARRALAGDLGQAEH